jgi:hypothetical protein
MNRTFPVALRHALIMELIETLPQLPAAVHAEAMRFVLAQCDTIGDQAGHGARQDCMVRCIHAYQRRSGQETQVEKFVPANDEEARIAAEYFTEIDPKSIPPCQVIAHLDNLLAAMDWADAMSDREGSERALISLCVHCEDTFALVNGLPALLKKDAAWGALPALRAGFAQKALLLVPVTSVACQGALISVAFHLADPHSAMRKQAERDGRTLMEEVFDAKRPANVGWLADNLFYGDVIHALIKRVESWPEPNARLAMLRELAAVAWEKGEMAQMEKLCAAICKLDPPDPAALQALMQANMEESAFAHMEIASRDVIPYLLCAPPGLPRVAALDTLNLFMMKLPKFEQRLKVQLRYNKLFFYGLQARARLIGTYLNSNEPALERLAGAAMPAARRTADAASTPARAGSVAHPQANAMVHRLGQLFAPAAGPGE